MKWSEPRVDAFRAKLDQLSADIKELESYLEGCCAFVTVTYPFGDGSHQVAWMLAEPDRWRLVHVVDGKAQRPLLETKVDIRMAASKVLHQFLARVGDVLAAVDRDPL